MFWLSDKYDQKFEGDIRGTDVYGADGEKLGTVDDVILDSDSSDVRYLVVDAGWLTSRKFIVPADQVFAGANNDDDLFVSATKREVEHLPEFRREYANSDDDFARYESSYRRAWRFDGGTGNIKHSPRVARFREALREKFRHTDKERSEYAAAVTAPSRTEERGVLTHATGVYGMYSDRADVERAIDGLKDLGFGNTDISVLFPDKGKTRQFAVEHATKAPEGALAGGGTGLVVGGALGWLAGIGALAIPGVGPIIAAGPIVAAITGAGVGSAVGGIAGALIGLGLPEYEAKRYETEVKKGRILVSVHCADVRFAESARKVLERTGAKDVFLTTDKQAA